MIISINAFDEIRDTLVCVEDLLYSIRGSLDQDGDGTHANAIWGVSNLIMNETNKMKKLMDEQEGKSDESILAQQSQNTPSIKPLYTGHKETPKT